jgi:hemerythrin-like metal-binding protein
MDFKPEHDWTHNLSVGIAEIDIQHKKIFAVINGVLDLSISEKKDIGEKLAKSFVLINDYVLYHFDLEETLMRESKYPGTAEHIRMHHIFKEEIEKMRSLFKEHSNPSPNIIMKYNYALTDWIEKHIKTIDMKMYKYLLEYRDKHAGFFSKMTKILKIPFGG